MDQPVALCQFCNMKKSSDGDPALSSFDRKNKALEDSLKLFKTATGATRDRLAREFAQTFVKLTSLDFCYESFETQCPCVHEDLRGIMIEGLSAYGAGGSFDLTLGGKTTPTPTGRPPKSKRDDAIRLSISLNIIDGHAIQSACAQTSEDLAAGTVDGLPEVTLTPAAVRSIWYAAPLNQDEIEKQNEEISATNSKSTGVKTNFENIKAICIEFDRYHQRYKISPLIKMFSVVSGVSVERFTIFIAAVHAIANGTEPNTAFHYEKTEPKG